MNGQTEWLENNDRYLAALVAWIRLKLEQLAKPQDEPLASEKKCGWFRRPKPALLPKATGEADEARQKMVQLEGHEPPPALILLANNLGLSQFDRQVLALCLAMELDTRIAALCAKAQRDPGRPYPTFALAFALFDDPDWNALSSNGPLRHWRLLETSQPGVQPLTAAALGIDERIVNYCKGLNYLDDRLVAFLDPLGVLPNHEPLPPSQQRVVDEVLEWLRHANDGDGVPVVELMGHDTTSKRLIAGKVCRELGLNLHCLALKSLPGHSGDFETFTRLWQRESLLMPLALFLEMEGAGEEEQVKLRRFLERIGGVVFLDLEEGRVETLRNRFAFEVGKPTPEEQEQLWGQVLTAQAGELPARLAEQFSFNQDEIRRLARLALDETRQHPAPLAETLWQACRAAARTGMEALARRIDAKATWEQLILPAEQKSLLRQISDQVKQRNRVYDDWGFRRQMNRGLGINALFAGESGTGKTMAAEVIANDLALDLYRIDLSSVVSKYIGETEKNLRKLFDAAEDSGAILFFDEADALFGKRSEVKDSHDRYANIEINYLLQRMEAYRGLAILATNMKSALDKAFMRRLRFIVDFPFPDFEQRREIWQKVFPPETPVAENLDYDRLARLNLTGGSIHNVALNAAFLAAREGGVVTMPLVLNAARTEFKKLERPAKESDFQWQGPTGVVV